MAVADSSNRRIRRVATGVKRCDDASTCTADACDGKTGKCTHVPAAVGTSCDDGDACTSTTKCTAGGKCLGTTKKCDDSNPCTHDWCGPYTGACHFDPSVAPCDDGDKCTSGERCSAGKCQAVAEIVTLSGAGQGYLDGASQGALYSLPQGLAEHDGGLLVVDTGNNRIRLLKNGKVTTVAGAGAGYLDGPASSAHFHKPSRAVSLGAGVILVVDTGNHRLRRIAAGVVTTFAGSASGDAPGFGANARFKNPADAVRRSDGSVVVADAGNHKLKLVSAQRLVSNWAGSVAGFADGPVASARFNDPRAIATAPGGAFVVADNGNRRIRRVHSSMVTTIAGSGAAGTKDGPGHLATFNSLRGIAVDSAGDVFVADYATHRIRVVSASGNVSTVAGGVPGHLDGPLSIARLQSPGALGIFQGALVFTELSHHTVRRISRPKKSCGDAKPCTLDSCDPKTGVCKNSLVAKGGACDDGNACTVKDACDATGACSGAKKNCDDGKVCTADSCLSAAGGCVHKPVDGGCDDGDKCTVAICVDGKCDGHALHVTTIGGTGVDGFTDGAAKSSRFYRPRGVTEDAGGNVYVADYQNHRVRRISKTGTVATWAGSGSAGFVNGAWNQARFSYPADLAVGPSAVLFVADRSNHKIRRVDSTRQVTTFAGSSSGFADGKGTAARFSTPEGIARSSAGLLYVADAYNHRIRVITADAVVSTWAGSNYGYKDGKGTAAAFRYPRGIDVGPDGAVWVADYSNYRLRRIAPDGTVTTVAGNGVSGAGNKYKDGKGAAATLGAMFQLAVGPGGDVFIPDLDAHVIRRVKADGTVSTWSGVRAKVGHVDGLVGAAVFNKPWGIGASAGGLLVAEYKGGRIRRIRSQAKHCADGSRCTDDGCDAKTGSCTHKPANDGAACLDANPCVQGAQCKAGKCQGGSTKTCNDANSCTIDSCDPKTGGCVHKAAAGCVARRRVFLTSQRYAGALGYVEGADARCAALAQAKNLGGTWLAWLGGRTKSGQNVSPSGRFSKSSVPYTRLDGVTVANNYNDLIDGTLKAPINVDESGKKVATTGSYVSACKNAFSGGKVWTNVRPQGTQYQTYYRYFCSYFSTSTSSSSYRALAGNAGATNSTWTQGCAYSRCNVPGHLYCFEQTNHWSKP